MSELFRPSYFATRGPRRTGPGAAAVFGSVVLHAALITAIVGNVFKSTEPLPEFKVYRVEIFSPPPNVEGEPEALKSQPAIVKPPEEKKVVAEKKPAVKPPPKKTVTTEKGTSDVAKGRAADPKALVGGEGIDVRMAGEEFPYPGYLENIIRQAYRYLRWNGPPNLVVHLYFEILPDGSVRKIRVAKKSGNFNFDLEAISAIEQAGRARAFGPLPKQFVAPYLPISLIYEPSGR